MDLNIATFREIFKAYQDEATYPDILLTSWYANAKCHIEDSECMMQDDCRELALMYMLAHLLYLNDQVMSGNNGKQVASASEGPVSVSFTEPPTSDIFTYWLTTSPYGISLSAMLMREAVGGFYIGGSDAFQSVRKANGSF